MARLVIFLGLLWSMSVQANGLALTDVLDDVPELNASIPTPEEIVGIKVGERHWYHHEILAYLDALAEVSPRVQALGAHATSYGGRALVSYAISSPENLARLDEIKAARSAIIDPAQKPDLTTQPAVMHMMYSIHGNEPSGANATPLVAYYLAAANDPALQAQLKDVVIIFNPMLNPDGLDRFARWSNDNRGLVPSYDSNDLEHQERTPNGRTNYYGFDLNRDWLPHQHPESQGRLALFHQWKPNVQLDFHEQGSNSHFFFMPGKPERTHPLTPAINQELTAKMGEFHASAFDQDGVLYFTKERYDDFFMGKGSTYPDLFGSVGILFEQPSARGAGQQTVNGLLTFPYSIANQFRASLSSLRGTSALKAELLAYQRDFYLKQKRQRGVYLATTDADPTRLKEFVRVLKGHQIEVEVLAEDTQVEGQRYEAGRTIAIPLDQPQATYLAAMWNRQLEFEEDVFYDVSTWTMPLAFNLVYTTAPVKGLKTSAMTDDFLRGRVDWAESKIGYLIDWRDSSSPALLYRLLEADANVRAAKRPLSARIIEQGTVTFGYGTLLVSAELDSTITDEVRTLLQAAAEEGTPVYPVASSDTPSGIDLGSREFQVLTLPKVLMVVGDGTSAYNTGAIWHLMDRRLGMPVTRVESTQLRNIRLQDYSHVILTNPLDKLVVGWADKLKQFVTDGGVVWAQGGTTVASLMDAGLVQGVWRQSAAEIARAKLKSQREKDDVATEVVESLLPERRPFASASDEAAFRLVSGVILKGDVDVTHPLGYGYTSSMLPLFRQGAQFMARSENAYSTPIIYGQEPLLSGYMSEENRQLAAGSAGLLVDASGRGAYVLSLDNPTFRAFWWGGQRLFVNAIFFGELLEEPK